MQKLHLVGFTAEFDGLIFSVRKGAKSGSFVVPLDGRLLKQIAEAGRLRDGGGPTKVEEHRLGSPRLVRPESALNPREMQDRIRSGWSLDEVAAEAGVDHDWVRRFAAPVLAEVRRVVEQARDVVYEKRGIGLSTLPLGGSVRRNVLDRGVRLLDEELDDCWSAYQLDEASWVVRFAYASRGRVQEAEWLYDRETEELTSRNRLASQLAHVARGRSRRSPAVQATVPKPSEATVRAAKAASRAAARPPASKPAAAKKAAVPTKAAPKKVAAKKVAPKKVAPKKVAPKKVAPKKVADKKVVAKKVAPTKVAPKKAAPPTRAAPAAPAVAPTRAAAPARRATPRTPAPRKKASAPVKKPAKEIAAALVEAPTRPAWRPTPPTPPRPPAPEPTLPPRQQDWPTDPDLGRWAPPEPAEFVRPLPPPPPAPVPEAIREAVATPIGDDVEAPVPGATDIDPVTGIARIDSRRTSRYVSAPPPRQPVFRSDVHRAGENGAPAPGPRRPPRREPLRGR